MTEKQKEIQASIDASAAKYILVKEANRQKAEQRKAFRAKYHEGNEFLKKEYKKDDIFYAGGQVYEDCLIDYVLVPTKTISEDKYFTHCTLGYCIKAPVDNFVKHIAIGLCGYQIKHNGKYSIKMKVPTVMFNKIDTRYINTLMEYTVKTKILSFSPEIPQRIINWISKDISKSNML